ncbi:DUF2157 domain-containing protein [Acetonema longum]|uniref:DUF2157 domain-containing protein n=1 Tax=Acetonema longum DSM 6540 TaxID=1009370 RepID=F7NGX3_9FIRM|nr:DUF2157 domain-containing protein [Acetonema longum]EGO64704.1 hypothetical protein ALO_06573 [Acetonema longum DSM 6540]
MNRKAVTWLYEQLPKLVAEGVIPAESADALRNFYGPVDQSRKSRRLILSIFAVTGVALVGLGVILILAHNWDQLTRFSRMMIGVGMLLAAQFLAGWVLWRQPDSRAWREGTATFLTLMIGASIALVGQTYHLSDDFGGFLLTWMLLSAPLVYLMRVHMPALLYLVGMILWIDNGDYGMGGKQTIWLLLAVMLPHYRLLLRDRYGNPAVIFSWVWLFILALCFGLVLEDYIRTLEPVMYTLPFTISYFSGLLWFPDAPVNWRNPYAIAGLAGCVILSVVATFHDVWIGMGHILEGMGGAEGTLAAAMLLLTLALGLALHHRRSRRHWLWGSGPILTVIGVLLAAWDRSGIASAILFNSYLLVLSVYIIIRGVKEEKLGMLNGGMLMLALLIVLRFLDIDLSIIARGLVFVVLGLIFLAANLIMVRRKKEVAK